MRLSILASDGLTKYAESLEGAKREGKREDLRKTYERLDKLQPSASTHGPTLALLELILELKKLYVGPLPLQTLSQGHF